MTEEKKIIFYPANVNGNRVDPVPARMNLPQWYKDITMFNTSNSLKDSKVLNTGNGVDGSALSLKTCGPFYDALTIGYHYVLSEDVNVTLDNKGVPHFTWESDEQVVYKVPAIEFPQPPFYHPISFSFRMNYGVQLPKGSSLFFMHPMNRMDLPFFVPSGVVDADTKFAPIDIRFFLKRDFEGVIKKGTPIFHVIPFTRESWKMEVKPENTEDAMWLHEKRRTYLSGWYNKVAQVKKEYN